MSEKKQMSINKSTHADLAVVKAKNDHTSFDETIQYLIKAEKKFRALQRSRITERQHDQK